MKICRTDTERSGFEITPGRSFTRDYRDPATQVKYTHKQLLVSLTNTLKYHDDDCRKVATFTGWIIGLVSKPIDPNMIEVDGQRLRQLFDYAHSSPTGRISISGTYAIDLETFRTLLSSAQNRLNAGTPLQG